MPYVSYQDWWRERHKPNQYGVTAPPVGAPGEVYRQPETSFSNTFDQQKPALMQGGINAGMGALAGGPVGAVLAAAPAMASVVQSGWANSSKAQQRGDTMGAIQGLGPIGVLPPFTAAAAIGSLLRRQPQTQVEEKRWNKLRDAGFEIPAWVKDGVDIKDPHAGYNDKLAADHIGMTDQGWNNNKFAQSRNEADLRPEDLLGYASPVETFGTSWTKADEGTRKSILQQALDAGAVDEHHGTVDINWTQELKQQALDLLGKASAARPENAGRKVWVPPTNGWKPPGQ
jgi:hypothetical protein